jgi:hypothetical protein
MIMRGVVKGNVKPVLRYGALRMFSIGRARG